MTKEPRGRIQQDSNFIFSEFDGLKIERLVVHQNIKTTEPIIVFLKVFGKTWHQYFLDAGMGFWEDWEMATLENDDYDDDKFKSIDLTDKYHLNNKTITKVTCEEDLNNSRITLWLEDKSRLILKCKNADDFDSECELVMIN